MSKSEQEYHRPRRNVAIVDPDRSRASLVGTLVERAGAAWTHFHEIQDSTQRESGAPNQIVMIASSVIQDHVRVNHSGLREHFSPGAVLVGLIDASVADSPSLLGAGFDLLIHEPIGVADIERALLYVERLSAETPEQSRERLRKMTALHQLAISASRQTSIPGRLDRLIEAGRRIIGSDALALWSLDTTNRRLRCVGSAGLPAFYIEQAEENSGALFERYESLPTDVSSHWLSPDDFTSDVTLVVPEGVRRAGFARVAWLPVRDSHRTYGHLSFYFTSVQNFEKYDLILGDAFSSIVAAFLGSYALQAEIHRSNRLYREHVEMSPYGVIVCRTDGTIERANMAMSTITARDRYEILGNPVSALFANPSDIPWQRWLNLDYDEPDEAVMLWLALPDGRRRRASCYARRLEIPTGLATEDTEDRIQLVLEDVTVQARRLVELELLHRLTRIFSENGSIEEAFDLVVDRLHDYFDYHLVCVGDVVDGGDKLVPRAFRTNGNVDEMPELDATKGLCGRATRENRSILVQDVSETDDYIPVDSSVRSELVSVIRAGGKPVGLIDIQTVSGHPIDEEDLQLADSISAHLGLLIEQATMTERLERQAMTDPLIGIANRRALMIELGRLFNEPEREPAGLFLVELDHFKALNDRYGHLFGDEMLKMVGRRLQAMLRDGDLLARYGGDELAMLFHGLTSDQAAEIAERLRRAIADEPFEYNGESVTITVSIGIALFPMHGRTTDELIGEADRAMYAAKLAGRNRAYGDFMTQPR